MVIGQKEEMLPCRREEVNFEITSVEAVINPEKHHWAFRIPSGTRWWTGIWIRQAGERT